MTIKIRWTYHPYRSHVPIPSCNGTAFKNSMQRLDRDNMHLAKDGDNLKAKGRSTKEIGIQFNESEVITRTAGEVESD